MKLLDQVREVARVRHHALSTERSYVHWIERYIRFHGIRHPNAIGAPEVERFLTHLATTRHMDCAKSLGREDDSDSAFVPRSIL
jgi:hypothetical protein